MKIRPLINKTRRNSAAAGVPRPVHSHQSGLPCRGLSIQAAPPREMGVRPDSHAAIRYPDTGVTMHISRITVPGSNRHSLTNDEGGRDPDEPIGER